MIEKIIAGDVRTIAKAITLIENDQDGRDELIDSLYAQGGHASVIGITGPPGAGKSTIVDKIIHLERKNKKKIAVIAVDPSSPFSGGAILGDRLRMQEHAADPKVFIRSMASRGHLGGLSTSTAATIKVLDAAGFDTIIIETVGVGQAEFEVIEIADMVMLILIPGMGDEIQALKAGIMEIADIYVINKSDIDGADRLLSEMNFILSLDSSFPEKESPPIALVSAKKNTGILELYSMLFDKLDDLKQSGEITIRRRLRLGKEVDNILALKLKEHMNSKLNTIGDVDSRTERLYKREIGPYEFVNMKLPDFLKERL